MQEVREGGWAPESLKMKFELEAKMWDQDLREGKMAVEQFEELRKDWSRSKVKVDIFRRVHERDGRRNKSDLLLQFLKISRMIENIAFEAQYEIQIWRQR